MRFLKPECPFCNKNGEVIKHGAGNAGLQRYLCKGCSKTFQTRYYYRASYQSIDGQIHQLVQSGKSLKEISEHLRISAATVNRRAKKLCC
ncbi:transposase-like zinc-binding domain-containing protein [Pragia fontium]|uniref:Winged helix-turn-helix DNA-binding n=2 Tax=Pragia fontium TaxID=82985 RepID=A0AAJ5BFX6_9GAMM|nr:winged helix-turn-helix transcriptional regulator [Pragia fontium]AKJ41238.1 hypothetical protein QQ39_03360 [Pragia fontium]SFC08711.1 Winged helix-turn-helix DNA-binding [Pragia fontium DSM 5563 = ATCC 49100]SUB81457.1 Transposase and inactivated derivatives [Pragia fontium]VEJ53751.1 Transposase and inactivated derivatives [Pragia fontium]GKX62773.1 hypothetical protein SOASR032_13420 [Pragia fontium]